MSKAHSRYLLSTDLEIRSAKANGYQTDFRIKGAPGLRLRITPKGTKAWALAYKSPVTGKWAKVALGRYPAVGLAEAKVLAQDKAGEVRKGQDPIHDKRQAAAVETFQRLSEQYMREHKVRNAREDKPSRSTAEAQRQLDQDILPALGRMRADAVTRTHVMQVVETIAEREAYVAADRALGLIRAIYNWACGTGRMERDPTLGLRKRNPGKAKTRVLSVDEIKTFWHVMGSLDSIAEPIRLAMQLQLLTAARIGEVLCAPRSEFDLERGLWTIPAIRTKAEREHVLPLSPLAREIVAEAIQLGDEAELRRATRSKREAAPVLWLFPSSKGGAVMDPNAAPRAMVRERASFVEAGIAEAFNTHDLRRTVATQLGEMDTPDETIERILNHAPRTVAGKHYNHARYLGPMRIALDAWAERLAAIVEGPATTPGGDGPPAANFVVFGETLV